jgi:antitoxin (DNA-binding transcriptional repressor) of toxin-antitoxin stability system
MGSRMCYNMSMKQVTVEQASRRLDDLVTAAMGGEDVVLVREDGPAVRLVPVVPPAGRPRFGSAKGLITIAPDFDGPLDDFREYTR